MSIEGTANTEYASLSGKIRTFVVDKTLTISGACADAKATGDKLDKLIDDAATAGTESANAALVGFLDDTLTKTDKAAQAAVVGTMLSDLDGTLRALIEERTPVSTGSYAGTGEFTGDNSTITEGATTISFPNPPKLLIVSMEDGDDAIIAMHGLQRSAFSTTETVHITWSGNTVSLQYHENHSDFKGYSPALSKPGKTYRYMAIL